MTITPEQLDALEKLEKAATPGPWEVDHAISFKDGAEYARTLAIYHLPTEHHIIEVIESPDEHKGECIHNPDDADLIVAIRNAAPDLIAEVRRLTASLAEMRECYIARTEDRDRAEADRAVLVAAMERLATCECCPFNDSDIARAALAKVGETDPKPPPHDPYPYAEDGMRRPLCSPVCACGAREVTMCVCDPQPPSKP